MTLQHLKYAVKVADVGSMNEAAKQLLISQPSLSAAIRALEEETGIDIFKRTNKGVYVTAEGSAFWNMQDSLLRNMIISSISMCVLMKKKEAVCCIYAALCFCGKRLSIQSNS
ncbi:MAG: LysR family transcriptional regulator [Acutalibacteraceae bacterium]